MNDHNCGIGISSIFNTVFQYLPTFFFGIAVLGTPQCQPKSKNFLLKTSRDLRKNCLTPSPIRSFYRIFFSHPTPLSCYGTVAYEGLIFAVGGLATCVGESQPLFSSNNRGALAHRIKKTFKGAKISVIVNSKFRDS